MILDIPDITETAVCGHENHGIPDLDYILTTGGEDLTVAVDTADQKVVF